MQLVGVPSVNQPSSENLLRVQVEFLCPMRDRAGPPEKPASGIPAEANIGPAGEITALAVGYGHLVPATRSTWNAVL